MLQVVLSSDPGDVDRISFNGSLTGESDSPSITYFFKLKIFIVSRGTT